MGAGDLVPSGPTYKGNPQKTYQKDWLMRSHPCKSQPTTPTTPHQKTNPTFHLGIFGTFNHTFYINIYILSIYNLSYQISLIYL